MTKSYLRKIVKKIIQERLGAVNPEGLGTNKYTPSGWQNAQVGPQSFVKSPGFDRPGPDPEKDQEETIDILEDAPEEFSELELNTVSNYIPDGGIAKGINIDKYLYDDYMPANNKELSSVASYIIKNIDKQKDIEKIWKFLKKEFKKSEINKWVLISYLKV